MNDAWPRETEAFRLFVRESNRIEGIHRAPTKRELQAHVDLLAWPVLHVIHIENFVAAVAPGKRIRMNPGMDVRVGNHIPPPGGDAIPLRLAEILKRITSLENPWSVHIAYETLHPFMDGNGRSGRAIWLWQMLHQQEAPWALRMGFLHLFYYQTLSASGRRSEPQPRAPLNASSRSREADKPDPTTQTEAG